jgi:hypothetical protein
MNPSARPQAELIQLWDETPQACELVKARAGEWK